MPKLTQLQKVRRNSRLRKSRRKANCPDAKLTPAGTALQKRGSISGASHDNLIVAILCCGVLFAATLEIKRDGAHSQSAETSTGFGTGD